MGSRVRQLPNNYLITLDEFKVRVEKGMKDQYKAQAAARGLSLNAYVVSLLERDEYLLEQEINDY